MAGQMDAASTPSTANAAGSPVRSAAQPATPAVATTPAVAVAASAGSSQHLNATLDHVQQARFPQNLMQRLERVYDSAMQYADTKIDQACNWVDRKLDGMDGKLDGLDRKLDQLDKK
jgi:hypothetical protein